MTISLGLSLILRLKNDISYYGDRVAQLGEYVRKKQAEVADMGQALSMAENRLNSNTQSYNLYYNQQGNPAMQGDQSNWIQGLLQRLAAEISWLQPKVEEMHFMQENLKIEEEDLVKDKTTMETQLKLAEAELKGTQEHMQTYIHTMYGQA